MPAYVRLSAVAAPTVSVYSAGSASASETPTKTPSTLFSSLNVKLPRVMKPLLPLIS